MVVDFVQMQKGEPMDEYIIKETAYPFANRQEIVGELIRCKDCKYYIKSESYCDCLGITISDLDFCSFAERITDEGGSG